MNFVNGDRQENGSDIALFDTLYEEHHRALHAYLLGQCGHSDTAADLLQETFLRVWRYINAVRTVPVERRRFWLIAVARNLAYDHRRRCAVRQQVEDALPLDNTLLADKQSDPAEAFSTKATETAIDAAIQRLPLDLRTVLTMTILGEMTSQEISAALGIPAGTVRYRISQARRRIARNLGLVADERQNKGQHSLRDETTNDAGSSRNLHEQKASNHGTSR